MKTCLAWALLGSLSTASAEQYVITTKFSTLQPALFQASLNGRTLMLHRNSDGNIDITPWVKPGKNTLTVKVVPGENTNRHADSHLTLGAGSGGKWRTLYKKEVTRDTKAGDSTFVFMGTPSKTARPGKVSLFGKFSKLQPAQFDVALNGESVSTMDSNGNFDLTPFLKAGKNTILVKYAPQENQNIHAETSLTIGQQVGDKWVSLFKWGVGHWDKKSGSITFPIYR